MQSGAHPLSSIPQRLLHRCFFSRPRCWGARIRKRGSADRSVRWWVFAVWPYRRRLGAWRPLLPVRHARRPRAGAPGLPRSAQAVRGCGPHYWVARFGWRSATCSADVVSGFPHPAASRVLRSTWHGNASGVVSFSQAPMGFAFRRRRLARSARKAGETSQTWGFVASPGAGPRLAQRSHP